MLSLFLSRNTIALGLLFLIGLAEPAQADEKGDFLMMQALNQVADKQPMVCDYTVTYHYRNATQMYECKEYIAPTQRGQSSKMKRQEGIFAAYPQDALSRTIDFLPLFLNVDATRTHYVGSQIVGGVSYKVVEVTVPVQETLGPPPISQLTMRWFVGADNLIHRITARLYAKDFGISPLGKEAAASPHRSKSETVVPSDTSSVAPRKPDKTHKAGPKTSDASSDVITVEAIALEFRKGNQTEQTHQEPAETLPRAPSSKP